MNIIKAVKMFRMCQELHSLIKECLDSIVASLFETNELTNSVLVSDDRIQIILLILGEVPCLRMSRFSKMRWHLVQFDHNNYTYVHFYHLFHRRTEVSCVIFFGFLKTKMLEIFFTVRNFGHWVATYHMLYFYSSKMQKMSRTD